ncbi:MAG TPA: SH3 domain-containing protein [Spirochaetia bacterium]|nr:SH3 domain-containing protein [Spirochaetia bacterium]
MKPFALAACALLLISCSPRSPVEPTGVLMVPSRDRVMRAGDAEPIVTSWLPLGLSFDTAKPAALYGLILARAPLRDVSKKPTGTILPARSRVTVTAATPWEQDGRSFRRWYTVNAGSPGSAKEGLLDSSLVALITVESGDTAAGFLERKIAVAGGESLYNVLAISDKGAVTLIDTSVLVFPDAFHPSGVARLAIQDVNADGTPEVVVDADTIVSFQFLGASPLRWQAWLQERKADWAVIFRFNQRYGTDQGNSYRAESRAFSSSGSGFKDTVKVSTRAVETTAQGEFHNTIESFYSWNGSSYAAVASQELPQGGKIVGSAEMTAGPGTGAVVEALKDGARVYVFDRSDTEEAAGGTRGFWYHVVSTSDKEGWVHAGRLALSRIDPLKENRESFLGRSAFTPPSPLSP